jgi:hypothetical protein
LLRRSSPPEARTRGARAAYPAAQSRRGARSGDEVDDAAAARQCRLAHGGGHTGWSRAWLINFFARLGDGKAVEDNLRALLAKEESEDSLILREEPPEYGRKKD